MTRPSGSRPVVHLWLPDLSRVRGGIQAYGADFLRALERVWPESSRAVYLKNDPGTPPGFEDSDAKLHAFGRCPALARSAVYAARVLAAGARRRPDLVVAGHVHFAFLADRLNRAVGTPYWVLTYGLEAWDLDRPSGTRALHRAARVLAISRTTAERLTASHGVDPARIDLLPCTFDPERFRPGPRPERLLERHGLLPDQPVILTVARLAGADRHKGYDLVLDALPEIRRRFPSLRYVLVGGGPDRARIERKVRERGLESSVTLAGRVPDDELPDYYDLCSLFALPGRREGFGIVYLEALASGKPPIGGNRDGARDALLEGELGALVDPTDPRDFAAAAIAILEGEHPNPILRQPEELRRRAIEEFGPDRFRGRLRDILAREGFLAPAGAVR